MYVFNMAAEIVQNLTLLLIHCFNVPVGVLCWSLYYYASVCVLSILLTP